MRTLLKYAEINNLSLHNYKEWATADHHLLSIFSFEGLELLHRRYLITHADYSLETVIEFLTRIYGTVDENFKFTHIFSTPIMRNNGHLGPEYTAACAMIEVGDPMVDIFEAAKEALKTPICIPQIKPIIDSAFYLIRQIEICEQGIAISKRQIHIAEVGGQSFEKHSMNIEDYQRQKNQYVESLQKCLNQF
jgi:hypothetical protein